MNYSTVCRVSPGGFGQFQRRGILPIRLILAVGDNLPARASGVSAPSRGRNSTIGLRVFWPTVGRVEDSWVFRVAVRRLRRVRLLKAPSAGPVSGPLRPDYRRGEDRQSLDQPRHGRRRLGLALPAVQPQKRPVAPISLKLL